MGNTPTTSVRRFTSRVAGYLLGWGTSQSILGLAPT
jgi:hypothetical protein